MMVSSISSDGLAGCVECGERVKHPNAFQEQLEAAMDSASLAPAEPDEAAQAERLRQQIMEKGLLAYAEERRIEKLMEEIRQQVMAELGVTDESLAAMDPEARAALEERIEREVERRLREKLRNELESNSGNPENGYRIDALAPVSPDGVQHQTDAD